MLKHASTHKKRNTVEVEMQIKQQLATHPFDMWLTACAVSRETVLSTDVENHWIVARVWQNKHISRDHQIWLLYIINNYFFKPKLYVWVHKKLVQRHCTYFLIDLDYITSEKKSIIWQATVGCWILNSSGVHLTSEATYNKSNISHLGPYRTYHYFPEHTTYAVFT
jgi:hypothetical protein